MKRRILELALRTLEGELAVIELEIRRLKAMQKDLPPPVRTFLETSSAALACGYSERQFRRFIDEDGIPVMVIGEKFFITVPAFRKWVESSAAERFIARAGDPEARRKQRTRKRERPDFDYSGADDPKNE